MVGKRNIAQYAIVQYVDYLDQRLFVELFNRIGRNLKQIFVYQTPIFCALKRGEL
ncbi:hypothetical protein C5L33_001022 [Lactobacillus pasteurii]|nr:hypothetical protein C5L33_001022 [Lactobacillus pasteurii]